MQHACSIGLRLGDFAVIHPLSCLPLQKLIDHSSMVWSDIFILQNETVTNGDGMRPYNKCINYGLRLEIRSLWHWEMWNHRNWYRLTYNQPVLLSSSWLAFFLHTRIITSLKSRWNMDSSVQKHSVDMMIFPVDIVLRKLEATIVMFLGQRLAKAAFLASGPLTCTNLIKRSLSHLTRVEFCGKISTYFRYRKRPFRKNGVDRVNKIKINQIN